MIELTKEQHVALQEETPPKARDPETQTTYVLVKEELFARIAGLLAEDFHPQEAYPAIDRAFAEGWSDPKLDDYDRSEELKR